MVNRATRLINNALVHINNRMGLPASPPGLGSALPECHVTDDRHHVGYKRGGLALVATVAKVMVASGFGSRENGI
jgi:hypothetical protein